IGEEHVEYFKPLGLPLPFPIEQRRRIAALCHPDDPLREQLAARSLETIHFGLEYCGRALSRREGGEWGDGNECTGDEASCRRERSETADGRCGPGRGKGSGRWRRENPQGPRPPQQRRNLRLHRARAASAGWRPPRPLRRPEGRHPPKSRSCQKAPHQCPLHPESARSGALRRIDGMCQLRTHALQQKSFEHLRLQRQHYYGRSLSISALSAASIVRYDASTAIARDPASAIQPVWPTRSISAHCSESSRAPSIELVPLIICAARRMLGTSARAAASRNAERTDGV